MTQQLAAALAITLFAGSTAAAQDARDTLERKTRPGDRLTIDLRSQDPSKAGYLRRAPTSSRSSPPAARWRFPIPTSSACVAGATASVLGGIIGLATGVTFGIPVRIIVNAESGDGDRALVALAAVGLGVGLAIDSLVSLNRTIYRRSTTTIRFEITPHPTAPPPASERSGSSKSRGATGLTDKDGDDVEVHSIPTMTHGRVLVRPARAAAARGVLVGFHGYGETAAIQMQRLKAIPGSASWTLVSVQALHRFYDRRSGQVIAGWMTHEDREDAIADNLAYVAAALESVPHDDAMPMMSRIVAGSGDGVPGRMRGPRRATGIIAVGGDMPPELSQDPAVVFPPILLVRGVSDEWYRAAKFAEDTASLTVRGADVTAVTAACGHEWNDEVNELAARFLTRAAIQGESTVPGTES